MRRLTPAAVTFMMFGVVGLLVAAYITKGLLATEPPPAVRTIDLPVPIADIPAGTLVVEQHLGRLQVDPTRLPPGTVTRDTVIVGRIARKPLPATQPILGNDLYEYGVTPPLEVSEGLRAFTLVAGETSSLVDVLIKPGDYVDVHFTPNGDDRRFRGGVLVSLLKGVKILAINRQFQQGQPSDANTLTVEVTSLEASVLDLARKHGTLSYHYNPEGKGENSFTFKDPTRITLEEILGIPEIVDPKPFRAQMYRQSSRQEVEFTADRGVRDGSGDYIPAPTLPDRTLDQRTVPTPQDQNPTVQPAPAPADERV